METRTQITCNPSITNGSGSGGRYAPHGKPLRTLSLPEFKLLLPEKSAALKDPPPVPFFHYVILHSDIAYRLLSTAMLHPEKSLGEDFHFLSASGMTFWGGLSLTAFLTVLPPPSPTRAFFLRAGTSSRRRRQLHLFLRTLGLRLDAPPPRGLFLIRKKRGMRRIFPMLRASLGDKILKLTGDRLRGRGQTLKLQGVAENVKFYYYESFRVPV